MNSFGINCSRSATKKNFLKEKSALPIGLPEKQNHELERELIKPNYCKSNIHLQEIK